jgi:hypothetical protein
MHAEAVRYDAMPSKPGLSHDESRPVSCGECNVKYHLHYDGEAEVSVTLLSILADEIITARHPDHNRNVVLELAPLDREQSLKREVAWSTRTHLVSLLQKKSDLP